MKTKLSLDGLVNKNAQHLLGAGELFTTGNVYYVSSVTGSDDNLGTDPAFPKATWDGAVNACTANQGDTIVLMPKHAETITAASGVDMDVAGVSVIGLGVGEARPIITFSTATGADIKLDANDLSVSNVVFKCNIASQTTMLDVSGDDVVLDGCEFREGSATGLNFITVGTSDGDSDRLIVRNCKFHAPTAGNYNEAILVAVDHTGIRIENCEIYGDFDEAGIQIPAGGNAQVDMIIQDCTITNLLTGQHAIQINGTSSTGKIIDTRVQTDASATSVDAGGLEMFNVLFHDGTDQQIASDIAPAVIINDASSNPVLGTRVTKGAATLPASTTQDIFTISGGRVLVTMLTGEVTTVVQSQACNLSVVHATTVGGDVTVASTVDINGDEAGTIYGVEGDGTALVATSSGGFLQGAAGGGFVLAEGTMNITTSATNTGATSWELWYHALDDGASVASA